MKTIIASIILSAVSIASVAQSPVRCEAITRWGQCTNEAESGKTVCFLHKYVKSSDSIPASPKTASKPVSSGRCAARTQKGTQCSRKAAAGSNYCWQHSK